MRILAQKGTVTSTMGSLLDGKQMRCQTAGQRGSVEIATHQDADGRHDEKLVQENRAKHAGMGQFGLTNTGLDQAVMLKGNARSPRTDIHPRQPWSRQIHRHPCNLPFIFKKGRMECGCFALNESSATFSAVSQPRFPPLLCDVFLHVVNLHGNVFRLVANLHAR